ncbi:IclR family transcriptional regulator [Actinobacteria bacterium YIM 96077]|uniref:IclR family transcriptional regulator n=1 Tax=Phytoactinopolyspora halophila TaxID=1981511 RepID=A0A329QEK8_9ACTN|nr:IclR family transcriptional regulator [Phytoactinopolyspora halophila]AYY15522.1 IclR family transcriptional regulator [Actinobacteria bacterium YIM 96077]RAW10760.1 IclR family transcriptional regulator [Phytoactinopolyspora halophila]
MTDETNESPTKRTENAEDKTIDDHTDDPPDSAEGEQLEGTGDDSDSTEPARGEGARGGRDYTQRSVVRVCSILNMLQREVDGVTLNEIVEATGLAKPSAFRYMWTLVRQSYVERDEKGLYRLGLGFAGLQSRQLEALRERTRPHLRALGKEFEETANLGLLDNDAVLYLDVVDSPLGVRLSSPPGSRDPLHTTAMGKAICSTLPEEQAREILRRAGLTAITPKSITNLDDFTEELARVRKDGYAVDDGENERDGRCVAVPLLGTRIPAAISISAPAFRFEGRRIERAVEKLTEAAELIAPRPAEVDLSGGDDD